MTIFDLHMHSIYSADGELAPSKLVDMAYEKGLKIIALSDHDTMKGVEEITELAKKKGIEVIPAIECSTLFEGHDVHLLGYGVNLNDPYFIHLEDEVQQKSKDAFTLRVEKLRAKYGVEIDEEQVIRDSHGKNPWFLMMDQLFNDPRYQNIEDFKDYIPGGKRSDPAPVNFFWDKCHKGTDLYVFVGNPDFKESVKKIHEAGGIAVLAHPFITFYKQEELLKKAIDAGIDGIEVYSNYHDQEQIEYYEKFARDNNLLITCGSDFHGEKKPSIVMGEYGLEHDGQEYLDKFLNAMEGQSFRFL